MIDPDDFLDEAPEGDEEQETSAPSDMEIIKSLGPSTVAAYLMVVTALNAQPGSFERAQEPGVVTVVEVPDSDWCTPVDLSWRLLTDSKAYREENNDQDQLLKTAQRLRRRDRTTPKGPVPLQITSVDPPTPAEKRSRLTAIYKAIRAGRALHGVSHSPGALLPQELVTCADQSLVIDRPTAELATEVARRFSIDPCAQVEPITDDVLRHVQPSDLDVAWRHGQTSDAYLRRVERLVRGRQKTGGAGLETLPGLGKATEIGLRIAADLSDFARGRLDASELDRGIVLQGPPGCGKTSFAKALASTAGVPFIAASLQDWQGTKDGHLGTLLGAMRATFDDARRRAPCVLLVDEIDGFGDRSTFHARHRDYSRQVVNAFLEQLDGASARPGVFVIGCTNDASGIDPAILRPGRLEQVVSILLPDAEALAKIFRVHLGQALPDADLKPLADVAHQRRATGADVERWCRTARGTARGQRRPMELQDLVAEVGEPPPLLSASARWRFAIHEAGHAVACLACGSGILQEVRVGLSAASGNVTRYDVEQLIGEGAVLTRRPLRRHLRALLAGRAAEAELLGESSSGAGGPEGSDLAMATAVAAKAVASWGFGGSLVWHPIDHPRDVPALLARAPHVQGEVSVMLADAQADAVRLIRRMRVAVLAVADALIEREHLKAEEVERIVREARASERASHSIEQGTTH